MYDWNPDAPAEGDEITQLDVWSVDQDRETQLF
jgi:hypothetical protein